MRFRNYKNTDLRVSEVGFGLWTISTGWWGQFTEGEAIALMHKALDLGVNPNWLKAVTAVIVLLVVGIPNLKKSNS